MVNGGGVCVAKRCRKKMLGGEWREMGSVDGMRLGWKANVWGGGVLDNFFFLMIRRPPRSTQGRSSAASDVYKRQQLAQRLEQLFHVLRI